MNAKMRYYHRHKDAILGKARDKNKTNTDYRRDRTLRRRYGISLAERNEMERKQGGVCAICKTLPEHPGVNGKLHVDHNHKTGKVRELLCWRCNRVLGLLADDPFVAGALYKYACKHF